MMTTNSERQWAQSGNSMHPLAWNVSLLGILQMGLKSLNWIPRPQVGTGCKRTGICIQNWRWGGIEYTWVEGEQELVCKLRIQREPKLGRRRKEVLERLQRQWNAARTLSLQTYSWVCGWRGIVWGGPQACCCIKPRGQLLLALSELTHGPQTIPLHPQTQL